MHKLNKVITQELSQIADKLGISLAIKPSNDLYKT
jgi:hypothetical protein